MTFLDLCSGVGTASLAFEPLGWRCLAHAENDRFASAVLAHRFPEIPNWGDILEFKEWPDAGTIDLICGGTPCQSLSIAGLRAGLDDPRGNLALAFLAIIARYKPRWIIWENVPGVLSHNKGRTFAAIIGALGQFGFGWAYRVLDAQYIRVDGYPRAVPQRRRRLFLVGYLGDWRYPAAVLFEPKSMQGHHSPRRRPAQNAAASFGKNLGGPLHGVANCLTARMGKGINTTMDEGQTMIPMPDGIRLLMPIECERLQGMPDGWTDIPWRGKPHASDAARYAAIGNAWAVNAARWIGSRIAEVEALAALHQQAGAA